MGLIRELQKLNIIVHKPVVLKSGITSEFYIDVKKAYGNAMILKRLAREFANLIPNTITCVASSGYGGLPLASAVAIKKDLKLVLVREKPKKHGRNNWIDGYVPNKRDRVALIDDVLTSGGSLRKTAAVINRTGAKIKMGYVVVNRSNKLPRFKFPIVSLLKAEDFRSGV